MNLYDHLEKNHFDLPKNKFLLMVEYQTTNLNIIGENIVPEIQKIINEFNFNQIIDFQNDYNLSIVTAVFTD